MEATEDPRSDPMHRRPDPPSKQRPGIPPTHPHHHRSPPLPTSSSLHHRSLSQPTDFFNNNNNLLLPPSFNPPSPIPTLPPLKSHRRSHSDLPLALLRPPVKLELTSSPNDADDLLSAYMNLDSLEPLNSSEDHQPSGGSKTNNCLAGDSSENEAESSTALVVYEAKEGNKRSAATPPLPLAALPPPRHSRSLSMDSFMGKLNFGESSSMLLPSPNTLGLQFGNGDFNAAEVNKIMANEKLAEIAVTDPRRVKRILANRQSAARSKERKMRYITELEHKVQTLQSETTTLSTQLTLYQREYSELSSQNNELKFRLQAMDQQAKLRDALNEALSGEVQRLKIFAAEMSEAHLSNSLNQQIQLSPQIFQQLQKQQQQQCSQIPVYQLQQQEQQQQQSNSVLNNETNN